MKFLSVLPFAFLVPQILATTSTPIVQPTPVPELSDITWKSDSTGFDAAKVQPVNASTYDWWYFDAIQLSDDPAQQASVVITFYTAVPSGFDFLQPYAAQGFTSLTLTDVLIHWPNGTAESYFFNATEARITTNTADNGVHGAWIENPDKISFMGSPDMTTWQVELDSEAWISGTVTLQSVSFFIYTTDYTDLRCRLHLHTSPVALLPAVRTCKLHRTLAGQMQCQMRKPTYS